MLDFGHRNAIVIADEATTSGAFPTGPYRSALGFLLPTMTGTSISFTGSETEGGTYAAINNDAGTAISWSVVDLQWITGTEDEAKALLNIPFLKVVSASTESSGPLTLIVAMK